MHVDVISRQGASDYSGKPYRYAVRDVLTAFSPARVLDVAAGDGWLAAKLPPATVLDGLDFYKTRKPEGYRNFVTADLNQGIPPNGEKYDAVVCCEAVAYLLNPGLFLASARNCLHPGGLLVLSTPNPSYLGARILMIWKGFFSSFPVPGQNRHPEAHMPWLPLSWPQLWLLLGLAGFTEIAVHPVPEPKPKHAWERIFAPFARRYARRRAAQAGNPEAMGMWQEAGSDQILFGRRLVVTAKAPQGDAAAMAVETGPVVHQRG